MIVKSLNDILNMESDSVHPERTPRMSKVNCKARKIRTGTKPLDNSSDITKSNKNSSDEVIEIRSLQHNNFT